MIANSRTGTGLYAASETMAVVDRRTIVLPARAAAAERGRSSRTGFGAVNLARPQTVIPAHLPESLPLTWSMCVRSILKAGTSRCTGGSYRPRGGDAEQAWRIVEWYKRRWLIEQFHRVLKTQGFKLEDSQIATATAPQAGRDRLQAQSSIQLLQARDAIVISRPALPLMPTSRTPPPSIKISKPK